MYECLDVTTVLDSRAAATDTRYISKCVTCVYMSTNRHLHITDPVCVGSVHVAMGILSAHPAVYYMRIYSCILCVFTGNCIICTSRQTLSLQFSVPTVCMAEGRGRREGGRLARDITLSVKWFVSSLWGYVHVTRFPILAHHEHETHPPAVFNQGNPGV